MNEIQSCTKVSSSPQKKYFFFFFLDTVNVSNKNIVADGFLYNPLYNYTVFIVVACFANNGASEA
jgi:hypothetical protein